MDDTTLRPDNRMYSYKECNIEVQFGRNDGEMLFFVGENYYAVNEQAFKEAVYKHNGVSIEDKSGGRVDVPFSLYNRFESPSDSYRNRLSPN